MRQVPVSTRALIQRINRKLKDDDEVLYAARGEKAKQQLGDFYVVTLSSNGVVHKDVDLEDFGRKVGALQPFEKLTD